MNIQALTNEAIEVMRANGFTHDSTVYFDEIHEQHIITGMRIEDTDYAELYVGKNGDLIVVRSIFDGGKNPFFKTDFDALEQVDKYLEQRF